MARLKSQEKSDDDLPDLATILRRPRGHQNLAEDSSVSTPRSYKTSNSTEKAKTATKPDTGTSSNLVPKLKASELQARRQRPLTSLKSSHSLRTPCIADAATAKEAAESIPKKLSKVNDIRETPKRKAKKAVAYRTVDPPDTLASGTSDSESTWCEAESEEDLDDTVIEDDFSNEEVIRSPKQSRRPDYHVKANQKAQINEQLTTPTKSREVHFKKPSIPNHSKTVPELKNIFSLPPQTGSPRPSSSSSTDNNAILRFSPPPRSPRKITAQISRPSTPSPSSSPSKGRLASPSKSVKRIPTPPHQHTTDRFWDQLEIDSWNEQHSPRKILTSPRKKKLLEDIFAEDEDDGYISPSESPRKRSPVKGSPVKQDKLAREAKKEFEAKKRNLAQNFLGELDQIITNGKIAELTQETGGVNIVWNKKLNSTAGRAHWKRESVKVSETEVESSGKTWRARHRAHIELAEKIIDDEDRLLNVLAHEFCHLANFMISGVKDNPHGKEFKGWAKKVSTAFHQRNIHVTTKHSYDISYKYIWECVSCGHEYKRHSKSIDPAKHGCGACKSKLVQTKPAPRAGSKPSDYQLFIKENFQRVKQENPGLPLGGLMEILGKKYREQKANGAKIKSSQLGLSKPNDIDDLVKELEIITLDE